MGVSTNGQICYGVIFEEDYEFPWDHDLDDWWLHESGWKYEGEEPYDENSEYHPGFSSTDPRIANYWGSLRDWKESHPCPVELVNYQSAECPAYMLACPSTVRTARRGYPEAIPDRLTVSEDELAALADFLKHYELTPESRPGWFLTSYWG